MKAHGKVALDRCEFGEHVEFVKNIDLSSDECIIWPYRKTQKGYGQITKSTGFGRAHRYSYSVHVGKIPKGMHVLHTCDQRDCINPNHLWIGTHSENMQDMLKKGRGHKARGEKQGSSKFKTWQVEHIIKLCHLGHYQQDIAARFNTVQSTISCIHLGKSWKHLPRPEKEVV